MSSGRPLSISSSLVGQKPLSKKRARLAQYFFAGTVLLALALTTSSLYLIEPPVHTEPTLPTKRAFQGVIVGNATSAWNNGASLAYQEAHFVYANATYSYRYSSKLLANAKTPTSNIPKLVFGICANSQKPFRRQEIRKSWAQDATLAVFIVAGDWKAIAKEFQKHDDLLWVNVTENYRDGLTPKTLSFVHFGGTQLSSVNFDYIFKTDDDVYVNGTQIGLELWAINNDDNNPKNVQYYGMYKSGFAPIRDKSNLQLAKWYMSREEYPDDFFPPYAPGVGYALSREFAACAAANTQNILLMPWEDVAVGLLAAKCKVALSSADANWPHFSLEPNSNSALDFFPFDEYKDGGRLVKILHKVEPWYFVPLYHQASLMETKNMLKEKRRDVRMRRQGLEQPTK